MTKKQLLLFDVDGTLAKSTLQITDDMRDTLVRLHYSGNYEMSIVGGGPYNCIVKQIGEEYLYLFDKIYSENGLVIYQNDKIIHKRDIRIKIPEFHLQEMINFILMYIVNLALPYKRGHFIDFRTGLLYITPMGRNCSYDERLQFIEWDKLHNVRTTFIKILNEMFHEYGMCASLGGQIGINLHPIGWDKSYVLNFFNTAEYESVTFYGDRCSGDGNDYPLYSDDRINGVWVEDPEHTLKLLNELE